MKAVFFYSFDTKGKWKSTLLRAARSCPEAETRKESDQIVFRNKDQKGICGHRAGLQAFISQRIEGGWGLKALPNSHTASLKLSGPWSIKCQWELDCEKANYWKRSDAGSRGEWWKSGSQAFPVSFSWTKIVNFLPQLGPSHKDIVKQTSSPLPGLPRPAAHTQASWHRFTRALILVKHAMEGGMRKMRRNPRLTS